MRPPIITAILLAIAALVAAGYAGSADGMRALIAAVLATAFNAVAMCLLGAIAYGDGMDDGLAKYGED